MFTTIIQARFSSSRLPGKVLLDLNGKTVLARVIERVARAKFINQIIVATSTDSADDKVAEEAQQQGAIVVRGSLEDVLNRFTLAAASTHKNNHLVRVTADCPLIDPEVLDIILEYFQNHSYDYVSNTITPTFPDGMDVEVFNKETLYRAAQEAVLPSDREHVTKFIYTNPEKFRLFDFRSKADLSNLRWTLDTPADYEFISKIYQHFKNSAFLFGDVLNYLEQNQQLSSINSHYRRNEGLEVSLAKDK